MEEEMEFSELVYRVSDFSLPRLADLMNERFAITAVRFGEGRCGRYAVVTVDGEEYVTSSEVLISQLERIQEALKKVRRVWVTLRERGRYYTFE